jgi:hypothetical protein
MSVSQRILKSEMSLDRLYLAQQTIALPSGSSTFKIRLQDKHINQIRSYLKDIESTIRPRYHTKDPLYVAYFNLTNRFKFDYDSGTPKVLSVRAIQKMVKDEMELAGLRRMSIKHLRSSYILEHISFNKSMEELIAYIRFSDAYSVRRYHQYYDDFKYKERTYNFNPKKN